MTPNSSLFSNIPASFSNNCETHSVSHKARLDQRYVLENKLFFLIFLITLKQKLRLKWKIWWPQIAIRPYFVSNATTKRYNSSDFLSIYFLIAFSVRLLFSVNNAMKTFAKFVTVENV